VIIQVTISQYLEQRKTLTPKQAKAIEKYGIMRVLSESIRQYKVKEHHQMIWWQKRALPLMMILEALMIAAVVLFIAKVI